jgi:iron complex outermembrane receptor protein
MLKKFFTSTVMLVLLFIWGISTAMAQSGTVQGTIVDASDGSPLPGATVLVKGTTNGTVTDMNGKYSIQVKGNATLVFSYVGYISQEVVVQPNTTVNIKLEPTAANLNELVVIGYGTVKKSDATGSVSVVSSKDFNRGNITSPQQLLIGKSAGVVINENSGAPGAGATIRIRGGSSLNASNDPLIIVDGVPIDNNAVSGSSNILDFINPNDIASFTVLKDASATAIYGSRASNGVIIITTKKAHVGSKFKLTYDGSATLSAPMKYMDVYSGDQIRQIAYDHKSLYGADSYDALGSYNTNWQDQIYRVALSQNHNIGISGSYKTLPYRVTLGYTGQNGILKNTGLKRFTGSVNLNPTFFKKSLKVNINAKGMNINNNFGDDGAVGSAISMDPSQPVKDGNPASDGYYQWSNYGASLGTANPLSQALLVDNKSVVNRFIGNIELDYTLPFFKDLRAHLNLATDVTKSEGHNNKPVTANPNIIGTYVNGQLGNYNARNTNNLLDFYLNYVKEVKSIKSKFDATVGYSWQRFHMENYNYTRDAKDPYGITPDSISHINDLQLISFFGRFNYTLNNKYLLTFTLRDDGSSRFSPENRWGLFPSAAFAWKIKDENFLKDVNWLSQLKLRLGWGITGQQGIGNNYYPYMATYRSSQDGYYYLFNGKYIPTLRPNAYDPNIRWEQTSTKNIGLDFGFLNGRISGSLDYYFRVTKDLLEDITIPTGSNFSNHLYTNVGSLQNQGVELALNAVAIAKKDLSLNIGFNASYNQNKITKLLSTNDPNYIGILYGSGMTGMNQVSRVGYAAHSFFVNKQVYDASGNPIEGMYVDLSGKGGTVSGDNDDKYIDHNPAPVVLMGLSFRFTYKNWDASTSTRLSLGNYVYNMVAAGASYDQMYQIGYWKNMPTQLSKTNFVKRQFSSDYFVENASFFKMDNLSIGYEFNNKANNRFKAHVSLTVQNVFTITKYSGLDPEVPGGIDNNFYPRARSFVLGVRLSY